MTKNMQTSIAIDTLLFAIAIGSITSTALVAPNALELLEKPLDKIFKHLDERQKQRELSKLRSYLKTQGLVRGDYDHGIILTKKAYKRIESYDFKHIIIPAQEKWDRKWRIILFDIPESKRQARISFTNKIQQLGYQILQQSAWIHPYPSKDVIAKIAQFYRVEQWVTYIETDHIDNDAHLRQRFKSIIV